MNPQTLVSLTLIADERFLGNCSNVETLIAIKRDSLRTAIYGEGLEFYSFCAENNINL